MSQLTKTPIAKRSRTIKKRPWLRVEPRSIGIKISELPELTDLTGADEVTTLAGGINYRSPLSAVSAFSSFASLSTATAASIPSGIDTVQTLNYATPGDGGGAKYKRAVSEPAHEGKFQDAGGAWWEYVHEGPMRIEQFGGKADSDTLGTPATDNWQPFQDAMSLARLDTTIGGSTLTGIVPRIEFGVGNYYFSKTLDLRSKVHLFGQCSGHWTRNAGTCFHFPPDTTGIRLQQVNTAGNAGRGLLQWVSGTNYSVGSYVLNTVNVNKHYRCSVDGGTSSTVQPMHETIGQEVVGADGFGWVYEGWRGTASGSLIEGITVVQNAYACHYAAMWASGYNYSSHTVQSTTGRRFYQCTTDGGTSSSEEPTHTTIGQEVIGADGFGWTYLGGDDRNAHSFHMRTNGTIRNCLSYGASGDGFAIIATAGSLTIEGNCNNWIMDTCRAEEFGGNGMRVVGQDTNGGKCYNFVTHGLAGDFGCGIYDDSGWACTYITPQITGYGNMGVHKDGLLYFLISQSVGAGEANAPGTDDSVWYPFAPGVAVPGRWNEWSATPPTPYKLQLPIFSSDTSAAFIAPYVEGSGRCHIAGQVYGGNGILTNTSPGFKSVDVPINAMMAPMGAGGKRSFIAGTPGYENNGLSVWAAVGTAVHPDENQMNILEHLREKDGARYEYKYSGGDLVYGAQGAKTIWHISAATTTQKYGRAAMTVPHMMSFVNYALQEPNNTTQWRIHGIRSTTPMGGEWAKGEFRWNSDPSLSESIGWVCTTGGATAVVWTTGQAASSNPLNPTYRKTSGGGFYRCTEGGTSTIEPTHTGVGVEVDAGDGVGWTYLGNTEAVWSPLDSPLSFQNLVAPTVTNFTLTPLTSPKETVYSGAMTTNRTVTLSTTSAVAGQRWRITRTATDTAGPWMLNVGSPTLKALPVNSWCDVTFDGTAWYLSAYGAL